MKKQIKYLIAGGILLVVLVVSLVFLNQWAADSSSSAASSSTELFKADSVYLNQGRTIKEISTIDFSNKTGSYTIKQTDAETGTFSIRELEGTPFDQKLLNSVGTFASTFYASDTITDPKDGAVEWEKFGLDKPTAQVTTTYTDGSTFSVEIGAPAPGGLGYYGRITDGDTVYLFTNGDSSPYIEDFTYFINKSLAPDYEDYALGYFKSMTLEGPGTGIDTKMDITSIDAAGTIAITSMDDTLVDSEYLEDILNTIFPLNAESVIAVHPSKEELAKYGLETPNLTYHIDYENDKAEPLTLDLSISTIENGYFYATTPNRSVIYKIHAPLKDRNFVTASYSKLVHRLFLFPALDTISTLSVTANGKTYDFDIKFDPVTEENKGRDYTVTYEGQPLKRESFSKFYQVIVGIKKDEVIQGSFTPEGEPSLRLEYKSLDGKSSDIVEFFPNSKDKRRHYVRVNGEFEFTSRSIYVNKAIADIDKVLKGEAISTDF